MQRSMGKRKSDAERHFFRRLFNGFKGYGPEQGYLWLRKSISQNDYLSRGCDISADEIFISGDN